METPSNIKKIVNKKLETLAKEKEVISTKMMMEMADKASNRPSFKAQIAKDGLSIIGEIKKGVTI